jgi:DNA-directed RNA polymerase sigma subunit (sigma70/sigma32)
MKRNAFQFLETGNVPEKMTLHEIAEFCGVDRMVIHTTEQRALEKLRSKFSKLDL